MNGSIRDLAMDKITRGLGVHKYIVEVRQKKINILLKSLSIRFDLKKKIRKEDSIHLRRSDLVCGSLYGSIGPVVRFCS